MSSQIYEDGTYLRHNPGWHADDSAWKARQIMRMLEAHHLRPGSVCEVGCGAGGVLTALADSLGPETTLAGYDISPNALALCAGKQRPNLSFHCADLLAEPGLHCDLLLVIDVVEHVDDYLGFLRRVRAKGVLKIYHFPLDFCALTAVHGSRLMDQRRNLGHLHYFTRETALAALAETGHEVVDHFYTRTNLDLPPRGLKAGVLNALRRGLYAFNQDLGVRILGGCSLLVLAR